MAKESKIDSAAEVIQRVFDRAAKLISLRPHGGDPLGHQFGHQFGHYILVFLPAIGGDLEIHDLRQRLPDLVFKGKSPDSMDVFDAAAVLNGVIPALDRELILDDLAGI